MLQPETSQVYLLMAKLSGSQQSENHSPKVTEVHPLLGAPVSQDPLLPEQGPLSSSSKGSLLSAFTLFFRGDMFAQEKDRDTCRHHTIFSVHPLLFFKEESYDFQSNAGSHMYVLFECPGADLGSEARTGSQGRAEPSPCPAAFSSSLFLLPAGFPREVVGREEVTERTEGTSGIYRMPYIVCFSFWFVNVGYLCILSYYKCIQTHVLYAS